MKTAKIEGQFQVDQASRFAWAEGGMVSSAFPEATRAGVEILRLGGNAVDAACATALALGVCEPQASGIGGQSIAILHINGQTIALDGSSRIPSLAHASKMQPGDRSNGCRAATVPSTIAVLGHLNFHYGKLPWHKVVEPAIAIAENGYRITSLQHRLQVRELEKFKTVPDQSGMRYFLNDGQPYKVGEMFRQPDLAKTLAHIAEHGPKSFYEGKIARAIDEQMREQDGFLRAEDLALIPWPIECKPIYRRYRKILIATVPPPAAGRTLLLTLMILNQFPTKVLRNQRPETFHLLAECFRKAMLQRKQRPFDRQTYPQIKDKITRAFARSTAETIRDSIDPELPIIDLPEEGGDTTHLSVMDNQGNAIGITQSIERVYGSKAAAEGLGFLYNNYLMACEFKDPSHPYFLRPNGVPWSTVAPMIAFDGRKPWLVAGSPGSERIFSSVSQFLVHIIDKDMSLDQALLEPRFHCSVGGKISLEAGRFPPGVVDYLAQIGYQIDPREDWSFYLGAIHAVMAQKTGPGFQGVAEVRRDGIAAGP